MKKILLFCAICLFINSVSGQTTRRWVKTCVFDGTVSIEDSVFHPDANGDISAFPWTASFKTIGLSAPIVIDIGSSNIPIDTTAGVVYYAFDGFPVDSLPYTFNPDNLQKITNQDTTTHVDFRDSESFGFPRPQFSVTATTDSIFTLVAIFNFSK